MAVSATGLPEVMGLGKEKSTARTGSTRDGPEANMGAAELGVDVANEVEGWAEEGLTPNENMKARMKIAISFLILVQPSACDLGHYSSRRNL